MGRSAKLGRWTTHLPVKWLLDGAATVVPPDFNSLYSRDAAGAIAQMVDCVRYKRPDP